MNVSEQNKLLDEIKSTRNISLQEISKQLIYLPSGALILTLGIVEKLKIFENATNIFYLHYSWILFAAALITILISHFMSVLTMHLYIKDISNGSSSGTLIFNFLTIFFRWTSLITFIAGVISFIIYITKNIN